MLHLPAPLRSRLAALSRSAYPREACGLLVGLASPSRARRVLSVLATRNVAADSRNAFEVDPGELVRAERAAVSRGLAVLGVWHSHPDRAAVPSSADLAAASSDWSYVIVPVTATSASEPRAWRVDGGRLCEEAMAPPADTLIRS